MMAIKDTVKMDVPAFSIVVYREVFYESIAFITLIKALNYSGIKTGTQIFIYDNTDIPNWAVTFSPVMEGIQIYYRYDSLNPGVSTAYNYLCKEAKKLGYQWMVLMDQDTTLPETAVSEYLLSITNRPHILLKAPVLLVNGSVFSPSCVFFKRTYKMKQVHPGIMKLKNHVLVNSGLLVNLDLFFKAGGYNEQVKLDFADFLFIDRVKQNVAQFEVLPFTCQHQFSHNEKDINKALKRYVMFVNDLANCPRKNFSDSLGYLMVGFFHMLKLTVKFRSLKFVKLSWHPGKTQVQYTKRM